MSVHGIQKLERGATRPYRDTARRLSAALQLNSDAQSRFQEAVSPVRRHGSVAVVATASDGARHNLPVPVTSLVGREATMREVIEAARCACIFDDIVKMPSRFKTRLGERGVTLSRGQQQRIALAQALIALNDDKRVLVLDEFTSAIRPVSKTSPMSAVVRTDLVDSKRAPIWKNHAGTFGPNTISGVTYSGIPIRYVADARRQA